MQAENYFRANVLSGLAGAGKTSVVALLGHHSLSMITTVSEALRTVLLGNCGPVPVSRGETSAIDVYIEAPTSVGPLAIASSLAETGSAPGCLTNPHAVRLGDLITVLAAARFWQDLRSGILAPNPSVVPGAEPTDSARSLGDPVIEQIEWASVVVVNKTDLVPRRDAADLRDLVRLLNPTSHIVFSEHGRSGVESWSLPRQDMFAWLQRSPGWVRQLNGDELLAHSPQGLFVLSIVTCGRSTPRAWPHFFTTALQRRARFCALADFFESRPGPPRWGPGAALALQTPSNLRYARP